MTAPRVPGDQVTVAVLVEVEREEAFRIFTEEIDAWWRAGLRYRIGKDRSVLHLEPKLGGRLFESYTTSAGERVIETGKVTLWTPPARLCFEWRAANFAPHEKTEVDVVFEPSPSGTLVTLRHRGFASLRPDHPVRHGAPPAAFIREMSVWWGDLMSSLRDHVAH